MMALSFNCVVCCPRALAFAAARVTSQSPHGVHFTTSELAIDLIRHVKMLMKIASRHLKNQGVLPNAALNQTSPDLGLRIADTA